MARDECPERRMGLWLRREEVIETGNPKKTGVCWNIVCRSTLPILCEATLHRLLTPDPKCESQLAILIHSILRWSSFANVWINPISQLIALNSMTCKRPIDSLYSRMVAVGRAISVRINLL